MRSEELLRQLNADIGIDDFFDQLTGPAAEVAGLIISDGDRQITDDGRLCPAGVSVHADADIDRASRQLSLCRIRAIPRAMRFSGS